LSPRTTGGSGWKRWPEACRSQRARETAWPSTSPCARKWRQRSRRPIRLGAAGHAAEALRDEGLIGASDDAVLELARREHRVPSRWTRASRMSASIRPSPTRASSCSAFRPRVVAHPPVRAVAPDSSLRARANRPIASDHGARHPPEIGRQSPAAHSPRHDMEGVYGAFSVGSPSKAANKRGRSSPAEGGREPGGYSAAS
jgi:hypothetical protein